MTEHILLICVHQIYNKSIFDVYYTMIDKFACMIPTSIDYIKKKYVRSSIEFIQISNNILYRYSIYLQSYKHNYDLNHWQNMSRAKYNFQFTLFTIYYIYFLYLIKWLNYFLEFFPISITKINVLETLKSTFR